MTTTATALAPPDRGIRHFAAQQTPWSWTALAVGIVALLLPFVGTAIILTAHGWTQDCPEGVDRIICSPTDPLVEGLLSPELGTVAYATIGIGAAGRPAGPLPGPPGPQQASPGGGHRRGGARACRRSSSPWSSSGSGAATSTASPATSSTSALLADFFPRFVNGAKNTLILSFAGAALGFGLGLFLALFTMSKRAVVRAPARVYINFFRGTPLIWQLSFAGLGVVTALRLGFFSGTDGPYRVAILVLGLNLAAYSAEVYRAGIQSLERGQMEAARSLGLTYFQAMRYVIIPQAVRRVIPPLTNEFVILIKDTSLVVVLGLAFAQKELLGVGREIYSSTFNATAWLGSAAGFLIVTLPMIRVVTLLERKLRSGLTSVIG